MGSPTLLRNLLSFEEKQNLRVPSFMKQLPGKILLMGTIISTGIPGGFIAHLKPILFSGKSY